MKEFTEISLDPAQCKREIWELAELLKSKPTLAERGEIQPFFKSHQQLAAFIGTYVPDIGPARRLAFELPIFGDFVADIVVGNKERGAYCLIELEDASTDSVFVPVIGKATKEWGKRFEHGFSQLLDWFHGLDDLRSTKKFTELFGHGHIKFEGMLIIGRTAGLSEAEQRRLKWRADKVRVDSNYVHCLTFDALCEHLSWRISHYPEAQKFE
jgi:hypothetical protein